jgi:ferric-dicitrate binding protein FerR (iron transport regulator)
VLLIVLAVAVFVVTARRTGPSGTGGRFEATERHTQPLARRGVAVLEPGAAIDWVIDANGSALVLQRRGEVFYRVDRVDRVASFRVETPVARLEVTGTSFRVRIDGAGLELGVDEGSVLVTDLAGERRVATAADRLIIARGRIDSVSQRPN